MEAAEVGAGSPESSICVAISGYVWCEESRVLEANVRRVLRAVLGIVYF